MFITKLKKIIGIVIALLIFMAPSFMAPYESEKAQSHLRTQKPDAQRTTPVVLTHKDNWQR